jgi:hypothetical protein
MEFERVLAKDSFGDECWSIWCWEAPPCWLGCLFEHLVLQIEYYFFIVIFFICLRKVGELFYKKETVMGD